MWDSSGESGSAGRPTNGRGLTLLTIPLKVYSYGFPPDAVER